MVCTNIRFMYITNLLEVFVSKVVIFGVGQLAEIAQFYIDNDSEHTVVAFTVDREYVESETFHGLPVVPFEDICNALPPEDYKMFVPISYKGVNSVRKEKYLAAKDKGYSFISYISSKARYYDSPVGENCFIFEDNVIQPFTSIGDNCVLWSGNHIGHHSTIKAHCFIASHVVISGGVEIGERTFIGVNATFRDNIKIGAENVIGAGALIMGDTADKQVFAPVATAPYKKLSDELKGF